MKQTSYRRHRFPGAIIQYAVWLYFRFPSSCRDIEDLLAERRIDVTHGTIRRRGVKSGPACACKLGRLRPRPDCRWHLDEVFVSINGRQMYLWRAADTEGETPDIPVQSRRDKRTEFKLMRKLLDRYVFFDKLPTPPNREIVLANRKAKIALQGPDWHLRMSGSLHKPDASRTSPKGLLRAKSSRRKMIDSHNTQAVRTHRGGPT